MGENREGWLLTYGKKFFTLTTGNCIKLILKMPPVDHISLAAIYRDCTSNLHLFCEEISKLLAGLHKHAVGNSGRYEHQHSESPDR
jgi:hypothetical protein